MDAKSCLEAEENDINIVTTLQTSSKEYYSVKTNVVKIARCNLCGKTQSTACVYIQTFVNMNDLQLPVHGALL